MKDEYDFSNAERGPVIRICSKCSQEKHYTQFPKYRGKTGRILRRKKCKACFYAENNARVHDDPEQAERKRLRDIQWREKNPDRVLEYRERQRENQKACTDRYREDLSDGYVRNRLGLDKETTVPDELIEATRLHIKLKRFLFGNEE